MIVDMNSEMFRGEILAWFAENQRDLPWRRTYDPYHIWISEIMLQQSQMERGKVYFSRWVERFPDPGSIAGAPEQEVIKAWEELIFDSSCLSLAFHKTAAFAQSDELID